MFLLKDNVEYIKFQKMTKKELFNKFKQILSKYKSIIGDSYNSFLLNEYKSINVD